LSRPAEVSMRLVDLFTAVNGAGKGGSATI
jgi:hypothetical protein